MLARAVDRLGEELNASETVFPTTKLRLFYELVAGTLTGEAEIEPIAGGRNTQSSVMTPTESAQFSPNDHAKMGRGSISTRPATLSHTWLFPRYDVGERSGRLTMVECNFMSRLTLRP